MTNYFVSSVDGNNAFTGLAWDVASVVAAKQTIAGALAVAAAGDTIFVDSAHNFTATAAITWTPPAGGIAIISTTRSGSSGTTPWLAGAAESVGAASNAFVIAGAAASSMYVYGITVNGGTNNNANCAINLLNTVSVIATLRMESCTIDVKTAAAARLTLGLNASGNLRVPRIRLTNCTLICSGSRATSFILPQTGDFEIINPTFSMTGGTKPAALFSFAVSDKPALRVRDGDASGYAVTSSAYFDVGGLVGEVTLENLKLSATPSMTSGTWPGGHGSILLRNCDSADTINSFEYRNSYGTITESASIYFDNGLDFNSTGVSWQIVTSSLASEYLPFTTPPMYLWNTGTGAQTGELEFIRDNATKSTDREIWSDMDYPASASFPNYTYANNRNANPYTGTAVDQPTSGGTWTGTGGFSNPTKQKLQHAFTAAEVGLLQARVMVGKASETLYVNPGLTNVT